jgi:hypothetical protein
MAGSVRVGGRVWGLVRGLGKVGMRGGMPVDG